jgi:hypothetical protein
MIFYKQKTGQNFFNIQPGPAELQRVDVNPGTNKNSKPGKRRKASGRI